MCDFCEKKFVFSDGVVNGSGCCNTMSMNLDFLFGGFDEGEREEKDGIVLGYEEENAPILIYDSSSGEYNRQFVEIQYCPLCGRKLKEGDDD